ncbi:MAG: MBL fold metallo-hydrolase, partial [Candidatus Zixiibacteriota bacterium]
MPQIRFLGHSCVTITEGNHKLIIDPWLSGNPQAAVKPEQVDANYVLVTHGHGDHIGDAIPIAKRTGATVIANFELASLCAQEGINIHPMHI